MEVHFYAMLRDIVGGKIVRFDLPDGATVRQLLAAMIERYPALRDKLLDENDQLYNYVNLFIDGRDVRYLQNMDTLLEPKQVIKVFPAVGGG
jgi:molybdopterin synthase sulfur carrier subunit